jgi:hypothetical protein
MTTLRHLAAALLLAGSLTAVHAQSLRPEVGKPLQQASDLLRAGKAKEALAKVNEADRAGNKTAQEADDRACAAQPPSAPATTPPPPRPSKPCSPPASSAPPSRADGRVAGLHLLAAQGQRQGQPVGAEGPGPGQQQRQLKQLAAYLQRPAATTTPSPRAPPRPWPPPSSGKRRRADLLRLADAYQRTNNAAGQARRWRSWSPTTRRRITGPRCWAASSASPASRTASPSTCCA